MKINKFGGTIFLAVLALLIGGFGVYWLTKSEPRYNPPTFALPRNTNLISSQPLFYDAQNFSAAVSFASELLPRNDIFSVVVPHHLLASKYIAQNLQLASGRPIKTVVVIGPNHENIGGDLAATAQASWQTALGIVQTQDDLVKKLRKDFNIQAGLEVFSNEHSIGAIIPFIKYYFPQAKIVPIIYTSNASEKQVNKISDWLYDNLPPESLVIASIDFSHYLSKTEADKKDQVTKDLILKNEVAKILRLDNEDYVDSPASLATVLLYASKIDLEPEILGQDNSFNLSPDSPDRTTSYFAMIFSPKPKETKATLFFGGDVMLSRVTGQKIVKYQDFTWSFAEVARLTSQADIFAVNLESPFNKTDDYFVPTGSFIFKADPQTIAGLKLAGINLISLANNHFDDQGQKGMTDTFEILAENNITYVGAGKNFSQAHEGKVIDIKGIKFGFLSYAYPDKIGVATESLAGIANMDLTQAATDVSKLKKEADVVIVIMHAGTEYVTKPNELQKNFAHAVIDAGADLVVGHHPHWTQIVEIYQDKPIIYSLGNLVFDQMWSTETQQGALAKVEFTNSKLKKIQIIPIHIYDYGQPKVVADSVEREVILKRMGLESDTLTFE